MHIATKSWMRLTWTMVMAEMIVQAGMRAPWIWLLRHTASRVEQDARVGAFVERWSRRLMRRFRCEVRVEGLEHLPRTGPVIIAANHQSMFDIPVCMGFMDRMLGFVAKQELFRIPGLAFWMRQIHCAKIDRGDVKGGGELLEALSRDTREHGYCMLIFPEGTRSRHPDGQIGPFRRGALRLAHAEEIPVVPLSIDGTRFLVSPQHMAATRKGGRIVRLKLAPPRIPRRDASAPEHKRFADELRETIVSNREAIRVQWPEF